MHITKINHPIHQQSWTFHIPKYLGPKNCQTRQKEQKGQKWCKVAQSCPQCL